MAIPIRHRGHICVFARECLDIVRRSDHPLTLAEVARAMLRRRRLSTSEREAVLLRGRAR